MMGKFDKYLTYTWHGVKLEAMTAAQLNEAIAYTDAHSIPRGFTNISMKAAIDNQNAHNVFSAHLKDLNG